MYMQSNQPINDEMNPYLKTGLISLATSAGIEGSLKLGYEISKKSKNPKIATTHETFKSWYKDEGLTADQYKKVANKLGKDLTHEKAEKYANSKMSKLFTSSPGTKMGRINNYGFGLLASLAGTAIMENVDK